MIGSTARPARVEAIIAASAARWRVRPRDILSPSRTATVSIARADAMAACRAMTLASGKPPSLPMIGRWFGRDHTTVLLALRRLAEREAA